MMFSVKHKYIEKLNFTQANKIFKKCKYNKSYNNFYKINISYKNKLYSIILPINLKIYTINHLKNEFIKKYNNININNNNFNFKLQSDIIKDYKMNIISYFKNFNKTNITFYIDYLDEEKKEAIAPINHIRFKPKSTVKPTRSKTESITSSNSRFNHTKQHFSNPQTPSTSYTSKSNIEYIPRSHSSSITARTERWNQSRKESVYKKPKYVPIINSALSSANCLKCTISKSNIITLSQCKHTICKDCLQQHIKQSSDKLNTKCPICNIILTHQD
eukprot:26035_1